MQPNKPPPYNANNQITVITLTTMIKNSTSLTKSLIFIPIVSPTAASNELSSATLNEDIYNLPLEISYMPSSLIPLDESNIYSMPTQKCTLSMNTVHNNPRIIKPRYNLRQQPPSPYNCLPYHHMIYRVI